MRTLSLIVKNYSINNAMVCLVQKGIKLNHWGNGKYLYWAVSPFPAVSAAGEPGKGQFQWQESLQFVGVNSRDGQQYYITSSANADVNNANSVRVSFNQELGSLRFGQVQREPGNTLRLEADVTIPMHGSNTTGGIGTHGTAAFVLESLQPNMRYEFSAGFEYYICVTQRAFLGDVVPDNMQLTKIDFAGGTTTMYAALSATNKWTISANDVVAAEL